MLCYNITCIHYKSQGKLLKFKITHIDLYQGRQIEHVIEVAVTTAVSIIKHDMHNKDLATKKDIKELDFKIEQVKSQLEIKIGQLEVKIEQGRNQVIIWVAGLFLANGVLTHFLK